MATRSALTGTAIHRLFAKRERLVLVPQNLYEFWAVATRRPGAAPGLNGLGMSSSRAAEWIQFFQRRFLVLNDRAELLPSWQRLVETHAVTGFRSHDVRLVVAMQTYGITQLLTFNPNDFKGLPVTVIDPASV